MRQSILDSKRALQVKKELMLKEQCGNNTISDKCSKLYSGELDSLKRLLAIFLSVLFIILVSCERDDGGRSTADNSLTTNKSTEQEQTAPLYKAVTVPFKAVLFPVFRNDKLIMAVSTEDRTETDARYLISFDIETGEYEQIFESTHELANIHHIQCNDDWLVWNDVELYGSASNIYYMSFSDKKAVRINAFGSDAPSYTVPRLMGDNIYWVEEERISDEKISGTIYSYNCKNDKKEIVSELEDAYLSNLALNVNDGKVVWNERQGEGQWQFTVYDAETRKTEKYTVEGNYCLAPKYQDGWILYIETEDYYHGGASRIPKILNTATGETYKAQIFSGGPTMFGDYAVANSGSNIWFYKHSGKDFEVIEELTDNAIDFFVGYNNIVITMVQNKGITQQNTKRVTETELHIFDFNEINIP